MNLRLNISEFGANMDDLHSKFESALAHLEEETEAEDAGMESMQQTIDKLGEQIFVLEDENDRMKEDSDRLREEEAAEHDRLEALSAALKDKISALRAELEEMTQLYEVCSGEIQVHHDWQEELASYVEDLIMQQHAEQRRTLDAKESTLQRALADLACTQVLLATRDPDLAAVQAALQVLGVNRLRRDLEHIQAELAHARAELAECESRGRGRNEVIDAMHAEILELKGEVSAQKARLHITNGELAAQLVGTQKLGQLDATKGRSLSTRAADAERRLNNASNQLLFTEKATMNQKSAAADAKWEGGNLHERMAELENNLKSHPQFDLAQKRNQ
ncbi:hypothetical protein FB451DRAFT_1467771 [Mycena latifolia]|nr:hypothetical protein FB451DRAFT_1467771 [Mycena latifolia]